MPPQHRGKIITVTGKLILIREADPPRLVRDEAPDLTQIYTGYIVGPTKGVPPAGQTPVNFYFDNKTNLLVRWVRWNDTPVGPVPTEINYGDYRPVAGTQPRAAHGADRPGHRQGAPRRAEAGRVSPLGPRFAASPGARCTWTSFTAPVLTGSPKYS